MWRRLTLICTIGAIFAILLLLLNPVNSRFHRLMLLGCTGGVWLGLLIFFWKQKSVRILFIILPALFAIPFALPGGEINVAELRDDYVRRMIEFEGTIYHWGGETSRGIDCSGLPRRAYRDALLSYGIRHADGGTLRTYVEQWWFDASAKALGEGYREYTRPLGLSGTIREMDYEDLMPGDLAVTTSGAHILAYAGDGKWIQADPGIGTVVTLNGRRDKNGWLITPVTTHRWQLLTKH